MTIQFVSNDLAFFRLACGIIEQAARDARKDNETGREARGWLLSSDCADLCEFINLDYRLVKAWVGGGCPDWKSEPGTSANNLNESEPV